MRRCLILVVLFLRPTVASNDDLLYRVADFHEKWDRFVRVYLGCGPDATKVGECQPALGKLDYKAFMKSREAAAKLYDFKE